MIIILDIPIIDLNSMPTGESEDLFTLLIDADRNRRHYVIFEREHCVWASDNLELSGQNASHLGRLREQVATSANIHEDAGSVLKVTSGNDSIQVTGNVYTIGHLAFNNGEYASTKTRMVVENLNTDSKLYSYIFSIAIKKTQIPKFDVDFVMGGGNTTKTVMSNEIQKNRIVVCLVDTDRISPFDRLGGTAKLVIKDHKKRNSSSDQKHPSYIGTALETPVHELENYIPLKAVKLLDAFNCPECLDKIVVQETAEDAKDCFWRYFDIKKGVDGKKIVKNKKKSNKTKNWISRKTKTEAIEFEALKINGIGSTIVEHFLNSDSAQQQFLEFVETEYWEDLFLEHLENLLWYMVTSPVHRRL